MARRAAGPLPGRDASDGQLPLDMDFGGGLPAGRSRALPFTELMRSLVSDICRTVPELGHVKVDRLAFAVTQGTSRSPSGTYAFIVPLRFEGGAETTTRGGQVYRMPRVDLGDRDALYIVYFVCPRFFDLPPERKLQTVIHELYHIGPQSDGDLRRFAGRRWAHGPSRRRYDETVERLALSYTGGDGKWPRAARFLKYDLAELTKRYGGVRVMKISRPRPVRVCDRPAVPASQLPTEAVGL